MTYSFDSQIASIYGVDGAVFLHNLYWWIRKNEANGRHFIDGKTWTYNTVQAFSELFPFWTRRQVERIIRKLKEERAIYVANYNQAGFDQTRWYALSETVKSIYANGAMDTTICVNAMTQTVEPIPDSKPDNKPDGNRERVSGDAVSKVFADYAGEDTGLLSALLDFREMRRKISKPLTARAAQLVVSRLDKLKQAGNPPVAVLEQSVLHCWQGVFELKGGSRGGGNGTADGNLSAGGPYSGCDNCL